MDIVISLQFCQVIKRIQNLLGCCKYSNNSSTRTFINCTTIIVINNCGISPTAGGGGLGRLRSSPQSPSPSPQVQRGKQVRLGYASVYFLSSSCNFNAMLTRREASTQRRSRGVLASLRVNIAEESVVKAPSATSAQC